MKNLDSNENLPAESLGGIMSGVEGIKTIKNIRRLSSTSFSETGEFFTVEERKRYVKGKGIVVEKIESISYFDCLHLATPEALGGKCSCGLVVCKNCLVRCAEPGCSNMVCLSKGCNCGGSRDGKLYCWEHGGVGLIKYLSMLLR